MAKHKHLTPSDVEELKDYYQYNEQDIALLDKRLDAKKWSFNSEASFLRISLMAEPDRINAQGRVFPGKTMNVQFRPLHGLRGHGTYNTRDRNTAKGVYLSSSFVKKQCWDVEEQRQRDWEKEYQAFSKTVTSDPEKLDRLLKDLSAAKAEQAVV